MLKSKWSALLTLLVVFLSGAMVGGIAYRLYMVRIVNSGVEPLRPPRPNPDEVKRLKVKEIREAVKLDDAQTAQVNQAYDEIRQRFEVLERTRHENMKAANDALHARIRTVLKPEQLPLYESLLAKWDAERKQRMEKMRQQQGAPPPPGKP